MGADSSGKAAGILQPLLLHDGLIEVSAALTAESLEGGRADL